MALDCLNCTLPAGSAATEVLELRYANWSTTAQAAPPAQAVRAALGADSALAGGRRCARVQPSELGGSGQRADSRARALGLLPRVVQVMPGVEVELWDFYSKVTDPLEANAKCEVLQLAAAGGPLVVGSVAPLVEGAVAFVGTSGTARFAGLLVKGRHSQAAVHYNCMRGLDANAGRS